MKEIISVDIDQFSIKSIKIHEELHVYDKYSMRVQAHPKIFIPKEFYNMTSLKIIYIIFLESMHKIINLRELESISVDIFANMHTNLLKLLKLERCRFRKMNSPGFILLIKKYNVKDDPTFTKDLESYVKYYL